MDRDMDYEEMQAALRTDRRTTVAGGYSGNDAEREVGHADEDERR